MKKNLTEIVFILDASGSMAGLEADTIGGFNGFLAKQKKLKGKAFISAVIFSDENKVVLDRVDIKKVEPLTEKDYKVGGMTALLDAIGSAITHIGNVHKYAKEEDKPENTLVIITTDGEENASREYTPKAVKKLIERQKEKYGWEFLFLGANIDAVRVAGNYGISRDRAVEYWADGRGTQLNYCAVNSAATSVRQSKKLQADWKKSVEEDCSKKKSK